MIYAVDPGNTESALVVLDGRTIVDRYYSDNENVLARLQSCTGKHADHMAIEMIASYGMAVGASVFDTCVWIGRFIQAWGDLKYTQVYRMEVKTALCHNSRAKDANIRQALIDLYGGPLSVKKGGPLHGISGDMWAALAVGVTYQNRPKT